MSQIQHITFLFPILLLVRQLMPMVSYSAIFHLTNLPNYHRDPFRLNASYKNCKEEGRPVEAAIQVEASNHLVNVLEKLA